MSKASTQSNERHYYFEGCFNFRDIGGYATANGANVAWGRYFRSGRMDRMTASDLLRVEELGIKTQIDLRRPEEVRYQGRGPLPDQGTRYIANSVLTDRSIARLNRETGTWGLRYIGYLRYDTEPWRQMFEELARAESYPVMVHCVAGKDRTGVATALVLSILGVDRSDVELDFILTNKEVERHTAYVEQGPGFPAGMDRESFMFAAGVREQAIVEFLDGVDEHYGGPAALLRSIGVNDDMQQAIRNHLLDS